MARIRSSGRWLSEHFADEYVKQAQALGYRSRAVFKLKELDEREGLLKPGMVVVDLGAAPGGWSQFAAQRIGKKGAIIALDLLPLEDLPHVTFIQGDFRDDLILAQLMDVLEGRPVDLVLSDMAPNLSGIDSADAARIAHLVELAVDFAVHHLKSEGALVVKLFHGGAYSPLVKLFKDTFKVVKPFKPKASRSNSSETFLVGMGLKIRPQTVAEGG